MALPVNSQRLIYNPPATVAVSAQGGHNVLSPNQSQVAKITLVAALALLALTSVFA